MNSRGQQPHGHENRQKYWTPRNQRAAPPRPQTAALASKGPPAERPPRIGKGNAQDRRHRSTATTSANRSRPTGGPTQREATHHTSPRGFGGRRRGICQSAVSTHRAGHDHTTEEPASQPEQPWRAEWPGCHSALYEENPEHRRLRPHSSTQDRAGLPPGIRILEHPQRQRHPRPQATGHRQERTSETGPTEQRCSLTTQAETSRRSGSEVERVMS